VVEPPSGARSPELDPLALDERLSLFNFARRDRRQSYLWLLRALNQLRAEHQLQAYPEDVAARLDDLGRSHRGVPSLAPADLREMLDDLWDERVLHRGEDASRAGSLARYRNRNSIYQFTELGYRAFCAVEEVLGARVEDANLSRLVFADILADLRALAAANSNGDAEEVYRKLMRLDAAVDTMAKHAARFNLALGDIRQQAEVSTETFLRYKNALLSHMRDFTAELDRYSSFLAEALAEVEETGVETMLERAGVSDERVLLPLAERRQDWRRRWAALCQWFVPGDGGSPSGADQLQASTHAAISGVIALLRQITEARRGGVSRVTQLRFLAAWVARVPDDETARMLAATAFNLGSVRHLGGAHEDTDQISTRLSWWDAPGVEVSLPLFRTGKPAGPGVAQQVRVNNPARRRLKAQQLQERADGRAAARSLLQHGAHGRVLSEAETAAALRLLTLALETRTVVAGRLSGGTGSDELMLLRLIPSETGSLLRTVHGQLQLPGFEVRIEPLHRAGVPATGAR
jgi:uncharacterized protein (TIGR02677 family)